MCHGLPLCPSTDEIYPTPFQSCMGGWGACQVSLSAQQRRYPGHISIFQIWLNGHVEEAHQLPARGSLHRHQNQQEDGVYRQHGLEQGLRSNSRRENVGWRVLITGSLKYRTKVPLSLPPGPVDLLRACAFGLWLNCRYLNAAWVPLSILKAAL